MDQEAEEDEVFQVEAPSVRPSSPEANQDLVAKAQRYKGILDNAVQSDAIVREKWDEWERFIMQLTWSNVRPLIVRVACSMLMFRCARTGGAGAGGAFLNGLALVKQGGRAEPQFYAGARPSAPRASGIAG